MRDRTKARNYSPERERLRREQARRREVGLARRHAQKLYHRWQEQVSDEPPPIGRSGEGPAWLRSTSTRRHRVIQPSKPSSR